jgi:hypothetical protein
MYLIAIGYEYFLEIWCMLWSLMCLFLVVWCSFSHFGILYQGKSGSPKLMSNCCAVHFIKFLFRRKKISAKCDDKPEPILWFLNIFAETFGENIGVFCLKRLLVFYKKLITTFVFEKKRHFLPKIGKNRKILWA